ncbi:MAG: flagellar export chaperone FliS [Clostridiales bacterium]|nr:flagellar export chaperone FliS [Clostridiales bacterium]MCF8021728.1 flagellar export chaperone FliS [Clostridiales bacterium]
MLNANPYQQYQQNAVNSATPGELTLQLYNGMVRFIKQGMKAVDENSIENANNYIIRAQNIINYLTETLDTDYEVSNNLISLYDFMSTRLMQANIHKDKSILEEVLGLAEELRDAWGQAVKQTAGKK